MVDKVALVLDCGSIFDFHGVESKRKRHKWKKKASVLADKEYSLTDSDI